MAEEMNRDKNNWVGISPMNNGFLDLWSKKPILDGWMDGWVGFGKNVLRIANRNK